MTQLCTKKELCGSCAWSHIPYEKQLAQKISDINGSFKLKGLDLRCETIIPSPKLEHYRNRMDFVIDFEGRVGMRQKDKWWRVLDDHTCFLADEKIDALFKQVRTWAQSCGLSFYDRRAHTGLLRYAIIRTSSIGESMIIVVTSGAADETEKQSILKNLADLAAVAQPTSLVWSINDTDADTSFGTELTTISGPGFIEEVISGTRYRISPNAFFQTNSFASPILLNTVKEFCGDIADKRVMDLYCGTGFFAIALANSAKEMIGVELNADAIQDAKVNAELNNVSPSFFAAPTENYDWSAHKPDLIILDPPRSGMHDKALADVMAYAPKEIVYISCNPKNFAREMVQLQTLYRVDQMTAIDMFPHTPHVELVTKLIKK